MPTPYRILTASCGAPDHKHWTERQVSNSSLNYPPEDNRRRGVTITFLHGCSNEADKSGGRDGKDGGRGGVPNDGGKRDKSDGRGDATITDSLQTKLRNNRRSCRPFGAMGPCGSSKQRPADYGAMGPYGVLTFTLPIFPEPFLTTNCIK